MNNKKGFTLIELLAVILVLGIIALIAIPVVNKVIEQSKKGAFERTIQNIVKTVEEECQLKRLREEELMATYIFTDGVATPAINIKGKLPQSGTISVNNKCETTVNVTDGKYRVTKSATSDELMIVKESEREKNVTLTTDNNSNGEADIGDVITAKSTENTNEEFYVISTEGTNIVALAKYNLKVGKVYTSESVSTEINTNEEGYGIQDEEMIGSPSTGGYPRKGITAFSSEEQKGTNYNDYEGSIIKEYVDSYKNKLPYEVIDARLITKEEIEQLVNDGNQLYWENIQSKAEPLVRTWIYSTSYWTGSIVEDSIIWSIFSNGNLDSKFYNDISFGVRPVITIPKSEI